eukprot:1154081-Pelagomonas_calceolata.AAC.11
MAARLIAMCPPPSCSPVSPSLTSALPQSTLQGLPPQGHPDSTFARAVPSQHVPVPDGQANYGYTLSSIAAQCMPATHPPGKRPHRTDNKLYRLQTPQTPLARTSKYDEFCMDEYPAGTNAVVAVLSYTGNYCQPGKLMYWVLLDFYLYCVPAYLESSYRPDDLKRLLGAQQHISLSFSLFLCFFAFMYTLQNSTDSNLVPVMCQAGTCDIVGSAALAGYDMEDAMILNKSSVERGLAHASVYKTETVDLREERGARMSLAPEPHDARSKVGVVAVDVHDGGGRGGGSGNDDDDDDDDDDGSEDGDNEGNDIDNDEDEENDNEDEDKGEDNDNGDEDEDATFMHGVDSV